MSVFTIYKVKAGDTLYAVSRKFGMGVDELKAINSLKSNNLSVGQSLKVRSSGNVPTFIPTPTPPAQQPAPPPPVTNTTSTGIYKVVAGDTLYRISTKTGMSVDGIKSLNGLSSNNLSIGQILKIRGSSISTPVPTPNPVPAQPTPVTPPPVQPSQPITGNYLSARQQFPVSVQPDTGFNRYHMTVPLLRGGRVEVYLRDNVTNSRHMVYPQGIMYAGQSQIELDIPTIQAVGLSVSQAKALQYVSTHEGKFDAINSYDKAIFSYGFIQFTGASAVGGSLNRVLASMEAYAPAAFQQVFKQVGIDTEGTGSMATTTVLTENGAKLRGDDAWLYIQRNVQLYGAFIQAAFEPALVREQLRMANDLYVQPALNFRLDVTIGGIHLSVPRLSDIIRSEAALTAVIALAVNQGVGGMSRILGNSVSVVATQYGLNSMQTLSGVNEQQVIQHIASTATDDRVRNRATGVLDSGLSFAKA